jgi:hypothetical protein
MFIDKNIPPQEALAPRLHHSAAVPHSLSSLF